MFLSSPTMFKYVSTVVCFIQRNLSSPTSEIFCLLCVKINLYSFIKLIVLYIAMLLGKVTFIRPGQCNFHTRINNLYEFRKKLYSM